MQRTLSFTAAVTGFHVYNHTQSLYLRQHISVEREIGSIEDGLAIAATANIQTEADKGCTIVGRAAYGGGGGGGN